MIKEKEKKTIDKIISGDFSLFGGYAFIYLFTNERQSSYLPLFDLNGKDVLTVVGSGDHILNILLSDVNLLESFDINKFAYYFYILKKNALMALTKDEFLKFFYYDYLKSKNGNFDVNIYAKIRSKFNEDEKDALDFWDYIIKYSQIYDVKDSYLFNISGSIDEIVEMNDYLENTNFKMLKGKLREQKIKFYNTNLKNLHLSRDIKKYDYCFISNIPDYLRNIFPNNFIKNYKRLLMHDFDRIIKPNGKVISYDFNYNENTPILSIFADMYEDDEKVLERLGYNFDYQTLDKDGILIYTKKR